MLRFGITPVPFVSMWTSETPITIEPCRYAGGRPALCQPQSPGVGRPVFVKPHMVRQRQAIVDGLCDTCGRSLAGRTKVSLSHARVNFKGANGPCVMQVEPLLHKACAALSLRHCPSLRRDIREGRITVRQVGRHRVQMALLTAAATMEACGVPAPGAIGHAKIELLGWTDRNLDWIGGASC
jgi:hypothetical protein